MLQLTSVFVMMPFEIRKHSIGVLKETLCAYAKESPHLRGGSPFKGGILFKTDSLAGILKGDTEIDKARRRSMKLLMDGNMLLDVLQKK